MSDRISLPSDLPFASLVATPVELDQVARKFQDTILVSFGRDSAVNLAPVRITQSEVKRRFEICEKWFRIMRTDLHYSLQKALDLLPTALVSELSGLSWSPPPAGQGWAVPGASKPMTLLEGEDFDDGDGDLS